MSTYCGREFSAEDIQAIRHLIEHHPGMRRAALSRKLCELFDWSRPNGQLKDMTCRVALLRMQADGLITLPASRMSRPRSRAHFPPTPATDAHPALLQPVHELAEVTLRPLADTAASRLWNEYIARYHYLGYTPLSGSQLRYNVFVGERLVAMLSFGATGSTLAADISAGRTSTEGGASAVTTRCSILVCAMSAAARAPLGMENPATTGDE